MSENRIDYTSRDYQSLLTQLLAKKAEKLPAYTETSDNDLGILLIQLFALLGDSLSYYIDRILSESFLSEASERPSVLKLAQLIGYTPSSRQGASVDVTFSLSSNPSGVTLLKGDQVSTNATDNESAKVYTLDEDLVIGSSILTEVGACTHGQLYSETFTGNGQTSQQYKLANGPVVSGKVTVLVDAVEWTEVSNLADKDDNDQVYVVLYQEDSTAVVLFGNGVYGKNVPNASALEISYVVGGGVEGRVVAGKIVNYLGSQILVSGVTNVSASTGGDDQEGIGSIKVNAPASHKTAGRAVTSKDFETITLTVAGVQQAKAIEYGGVVRVSIVPTGGGLPGVPLKNSVASELDSKRMLGVHVVVEDPVYIDIDVTAVVVAEPGAKQSIIQTRVQNTINAFLDPNQSVDGVYINGYGEDVFLSELYQLINDVTGVARCTISTLKRATDVSGVSDVDIREIEIRSSGTVTVTILEGSATAEYEDSVRKIKRSRTI